jgi:nucleotide-binding universal stress UspA family protein
MTSAPFRRVLVPVAFDKADEHEVAADRAVDASPGSWVVVAPATQRALELAAKLAAGGEVRLVHATPDFASAAVYAGPTGTWVTDANITDLNDVACRQSTEVLEMVGKHHCPGVDVVTVAKPGRALTVIMDEAKDHPPDAIVLAASGRGRVRRAVLGSTADKIIRHAFCPVIVVPAGDAGED